MRTMIDGIPVYSEFAGAEEGRAYFRLARPVSRMDAGHRSTVKTDDYTRSQVAELLRDLGSNMNGGDAEERAARKALVRVLARGYKALGGDPVLIPGIDGVGFNTQVRKPAKTAEAADAAPVARIPARTRGAAARMA